MYPLTVKTDAAHCLEITAVLAVKQISERAAKITAEQTVAPAAAAASAATAAASEMDAAALEAVLPADRTLSEP